MSDPVINVPRWNLSGSSGDRRSQRNRLLASSLHSVTILKRANERLTPSLKQGNRLLRVQKTHFEFYLGDSGVRLCKLYMIIIPHLYMYNLFPALFCDLPREAAKLLLLSLFLTISKQRNGAQPSRVKVINPKEEAGSKPILLFPYIRLHIKHSWYQHVVK